MTRSTAPAESTETVTREFILMIDRQAARVGAELQRLDIQLGSAYDRAHTEAGDKQTRSHRDAPLRWGLSDTEALEVAEAGTRTEVAELRRLLGLEESRLRALDTVWRTHGQWSRFFLVVSSDGHIHSTTACSQRGWTAYAWLPELSGLTEADAVEAHGTRLCSKCFPDAPVAWTIWEPLAAGSCTGSKKAPVEGSLWRNPRGTRHGVCTSCGELEQQNADGRLRVHTPPKTALQEKAGKIQTRINGAAGDISYGAIILGSAHRSDAEVERWTKKVRLAEGRKAKAEAELAELQVQLDAEQVARREAGLIA
jgi:hypothetical protein